MGWELQRTQSRKLFRTYLLIIECLSISAAGSVPNCVLCKCCRRCGNHERIARNHFPYAHFVQDDSSPMKLCLPVTLGLDKPFPNQTVFAGSVGVTLSSCSSSPRPTIPVLYTELTHTTTASRTGCRSAGGLLFWPSARSYQDSSHILSSESFVSS
jgi:hypothetical protein